MQRGWPCPDIERGRLGDVPSRIVGCIEDWPARKFHSVLSLITYLALYSLPIIGPCGYSGCKLACPSPFFFRHSFVSQSHLRGWLHE
jgi:hypothetical protein